MVMARWRVWQFGGLVLHFRKYWESVAVQHWTSNTWIEWSRQAHVKHDPSYCYYTVTHCLLTYSECPYHWTQWTGRMENTAWRWRADYTWLWDDNARVQICISQFRVNVGFSIFPYNLEFYCHKRILGLNRIKFWFLIICSLQQLISSVPVKILVQPTWWPC